MAVSFKQADSVAEFEQIHRFNYKTFAAEIGQHTPDGTGVLVDRFHDRNTYFIALESGEESGELIGMVSVNGNPPFSVEAKLADRAILDSLPRPVLEIRL